METKSKHEIEQEALATYQRFIQTRDDIDAGKYGWEKLADYFTEDAVYIDPAWGRQETREGIRNFFVASMAGLTGYGWTSPERWTMTDGNRLVSHWDQVMGTDEQGNERTVPGLSILYYAGNGLFCYSHDFLNMTAIGETLKAMAWQPPAEFNMPPRKPDWSTAMPGAWAHLAET